ncbi:hypothetical protein WOLCODRAFT_156540 [Wolfiporia cocos MD-104 SS10]|uniref:Uncharacterized protein n=1 Tax=Wolfiporia cocos (strain MD-104) TaxID=742152 RepID=A0A2H3J0Y0_WOLCO|nr:hypothetical protein WOLCODRAFT_156540 [Wolfiporia cocos MD-104 SS10]
MEKNMESNSQWFAEGLLCEGGQDKQEEIREMREHLVEEDGNDAEDEEDWLWPSPQFSALSSPMPGIESIQHATQALELVPAKWSHDVARAETTVDSLRSASHDCRVAFADGSHAVGSHDNLAVPAVSSGPHVFVDESYIDHSLEPPSTSTDSIRGDPNTLALHSRVPHLRPDVPEQLPEQATEVGLQRNQGRKTCSQSGQQKSDMVPQHG